MGQKFTIRDFTSWPAKPKPRIVLASANTTASEILNLDPDLAGAGAKKVNGDSLHSYFLGEATSWSSPHKK